MKPRLTNRVLRGILSIQTRCGGPLERGEDTAQCSLQEWDDAEAAIEWAHAMLAWRKEKGGDDD